MKNNTNQIMKLNIPIWIKYWLSKHKNASYILSEILTGTEFFLQDSAPKKFKIFDIIGRTTQESTTGKNLAGLIDGTYSNNNVTVIVNNGKVTINGTPSSNTFFNIATNLNLISGDYVLYAFNSSTIGNSSASGDYADIRLTNTTGGTYGNYVLLGTKNNKIVISLSNDDSSAKIVLRLGANLQFNNFVITPMLIKGTSTAEPYEPYTGGEPAPNPIYPYAIKNTGDNGSVNEKVSNSDGTQEQNISFPLAEGQKLMQGDYLADDGVHHKMGEVVLDGTVGGYNRDYNWFYISKSNITNTIKSFDLLSNYFKNINYATFESNTNLNGICWNSTNLNNVTHLLIRNTNCTNVTEYKNWLAEVLPKVIYELAEEQTEDFTSEQQTAWEEWKKARTYKNITHISSEDETPANLRIQYYKEG